MPLHRPPHRFDALFTLSVSDLLRIDDMQTDQGVLLHPMVATVTYLAAPAAAAPTVVLERPSPLLAGESATGSIPCAAVCWPAVGRHLCFDGKLLHGALPDLTLPHSQGGAVKRITLLVNVWLNHTPWGAEKLPRKLSKKLSAVGNGARMGFERAEAVSPLALEVRAADATDVRSNGWVFNEQGRKLRLTLPWPAEKLQSLCQRGKQVSTTPFVHLTFANDVGAALSLAKKESSNIEPGKRKKAKRELSHETRKARREA